jgi:acyl transferase domain-containing protein/NAD(P)-dependent dehydrogenase (short-subunit alcohol dehydrogenase family)
MTQQKPLAIVGMGCLFPKASNLKEFWANVKNKVDGITEIPATHWNPSEYFDANQKTPDMTYARRGGFLGSVDFDAAEFGISPNNLEATDAAQLLALVAAQMALRDAGYGPEKEYDRSQVSVILGVTGTLELVIPLGARLGHPIWRKSLAAHGITGEAAESIIESIKDGYVPWQENSFPGLLGNVVAGRVANRFNFGGTNCVVDAACASSLSAAHLASMELGAGRSKMVVTGGVDCFNDIFMYMCFSKTPALSPTGDSKPFDKKADGTILGEGLGMVVLKTLEDAEKDGDKIYAILKGVGSSSDGRGKSIYAPSSEGQTKALKKAYAVSGVDPKTIELVEAHGTGTSVGDGVEVDALKAVYGETQEPWCALGSVKSMIGHTKAAAGSAGMIKAALALKNKVLPPTIKVTEPIAQLADSPFYISLEKRPWLSSGHPRRAAVSALGFGGSNFHAVLEEHRAVKESADWDGDVELVALNGDESSWTQPSSWDEVRAAAAESRKSFNPAAEKRTLLVLEKSGAKTIFKGEGKPGKLGVLFSGQGSQYVGMGRDLSCQFPEAFALLEKAGAVGRLMHPVPSLKSEIKDSQETELRKTQNAQPALGAAGLGAWAVLKRFGLSADAFAGHSYGELPALCAAGAYDESSLFALSRKRGELMAAGSGDRGGMVAVQAPLAEIERALEEERIDLVIANKNAPQQTVLSGRTEEVKRAAELLGKRNLRCVVLPVAAAFHSPLVAGAEGEFRKFLDTVSFNAPSKPVYANKTAAPYPADARSSRDLLGSQLASAVEFTRMIERMAADGVTAFVECGAGGRLAGLVSQISPKSTPIAIDASSGKRSGTLDLAKALAQLAALGFSCDLTKWEEGFVPAPKKGKMSVKLSGANHRSTPAKNTAPKKISAPAPAAPLYQAPLSAAPASSALLDGMAALQRLQEQTAALHAQFLQTQEQSQLAIQALIEQQQRMMSGQPPVAAYVPAPAAPITPPAVPLSGTAPLTAAAPAPAPAPAPASNVEPVLIGVVSEKTGYPAEMLNLDMDLEADLGIDSIKRVEIMSTLHEKVPGAPKVEPRHLGTLRTLRQILKFLGENSTSSSMTPRADAVASAAPTASTSSNIEPVLIGVVSEKTGYPPEMLNLDMDLEADLGIDSIKRVEIMSTLHEKVPGAPKVEPRHLGTLRTLRQILAFLGANAAPVAQAAAPSSSALNLEPVLLAVVSEKTGYPPEMLNLDMDLEADLGIDSIKRVEIMSALQEKAPGAPKVEPKHLGTLRTLRQIIAFMSKGSDSTPAVAQGATALVAAAEKTVTPSNGVQRFALIAQALQNDRPAIAHDKKKPFWIAGADSLAKKLAASLKARGLKAELVGFDAVPADLSGLVIVGAAAKLKPSAFWSSEEEPVQALMLASRAAGKMAYFATVSRLDGSFGLTGLTLEQDPVSGALAGLTKTAAREWTDATCRAFDVAQGFDEARAAEQLAEEICKEGPIETGLSEAGAKTLVLEEREQEEAGKLSLEPGDAVVVTGGARGVTAEACASLAPYKPTLILLGRTARPEAEEAWSAACKTEAELKKAVLSREGKLTPKELGAKCAAILAAREISSQIARFERLGAKIEYRSCDVRDAASVKKALSGFKVRGLVHGAGVLADKLISEKTLPSAQAVLSTKVGGLRALLEAVEPSALKFIALFSSSTARYGRVGQSDYAMANEILNKAAQLLSRRLPSCRVTSLGWGPWDGGMVTAPLKAMFASEGVGVIGLEEGGKFMAAELAGSGKAVEVVVIGRLPAPELKPAFERTLSLDEAPFLRSHVINGKAVLPFAVIVEWLAHAALHGNPGLKFHGLRNMRIYKGVRLGAEPIVLSVAAGKAAKNGEGFVARAELRGQGLHAAADVLLSQKLPAAPAPAAPPAVSPYGRSLERAYSEVLFHGPEMRAISAVKGVSDKGVLVDSAASPAPSAWLRSPLRDHWLADPMALDAAFQAMILWSREKFGAGSLPSFLGGYRQYAKFPAGGARVSCVVTRSGEGLAAADIDFLDEGGALIARVENYECTIDASLNEAFRKNALEAVS